jgi:hypothetical protein
VLAEDAENLHAFTVPREFSDPSRRSIVVVEI